MKTYFALSVTLLATAVFSGCREADLGFSEEAISREKFEKAYTENFEKEYGKISAEQSWGFTSTNCGTRAGSESYYHYRLVQNDNWDTQKSITAQDGKNYEMQIEVTNKDWSPVEEDKTFVSANYQGPVQQPEKDYVRQYLIDHPDEGDTSCALDSYIIYNLGYLNNGANVGHMDELYFDEEHFQSYNGSIGYDYYVTNTDITDPWYRDSENSKEIHDHYRFYFIPGYGLYLCFDYGGKEQDKFDNIYNDWVLKIQPGDMSRLNAARRVFCEDLGSTHDLDFNDVVYDYIQYTEKLAEIKVYAVCGTLPIYFTINGSQDFKMTYYSENGWGHNNDFSRKEIHAICGGESYKNQIYYNSTPYADLKVECSDIMSLGIMRETDDGKPWYCIPSEQVGKTPFLIACPVGTEPQAEDQNISLKYPKFIGYPSNPYIEWWD